MAEQGAGRREIVRLPGFYQAAFVADGQKGDGVVVDISPEGLRLRTSYELEEGQSLAVTIKGPDLDDVTLNGKVRWIFDLTPVPSGDYDFTVEVGIRIDEPPDELSRLFEQKSARFVDFRDWPRVPCQQRIEMAGPGVWETTFAVNLSRRGMFVLTRQSLNPGQFVQLRLHEQGSEDRRIELRAEVVYVLTPEQAKEIGALPGIGLHLVNPPSTMKKRYTEYVESLEKKLV